LIFLPSFSLRSFSYLMGLGINARVLYLISFKI
jgi:hypothetical protein